MDDISKYNIIGKNYIYPFSEQKVKATVTLETKALTALDFSTSLLENISQNLDYIVAWKEPTKYMYMLLSRMY